MMKPIRDHIYSVTLGAQGQTVMLTQYYEMTCRKKSHLSETQWYAVYINSKIWEYISTFQNFERVTNVLQDEAVAFSLLNWLKNNIQKPDDAIINIDTHQIF